MALRGRVVEPPSEAGQLRPQFQPHRHGGTVAPPTVPGARSWPNVAVVEDFAQLRFAAATTSALTVIARPSGAARRRPGQSSACRSADEIQDHRVGDEAGADPSAMPQIISSRGKVCSVARSHQDRQRLMKRPRPVLAGVGDAVLPMTAASTMPSSVVGGAQSRRRGGVPRTRRHVVGGAASDQGDCGRFRCGPTPSR